MKDLSSTYKYEKIRLNNRALSNLLPEIILVCRQICKRFYFKVPITIILLFYNNYKRGFWNITNQSIALASCCSDYFVSSAYPDWLEAPAFANSVALQRDVLQQPGMSVYSK